MPGPRNECNDVRLALSNDALKIISVPKLWLMRTSSRATQSRSPAFSITQGPAMITGFSISAYDYIYAKIQKRTANANLFPAKKRFLSLIVMYWQRHRVVTPIVRRPPPALPTAVIPCVRRSPYALPATAEQWAICCKHF